MFTRYVIAVGNKHVSSSPLLVFGTSSMPVKPISHVLSLWSLWHASCEETLDVGEVWDWQRVGAQYAHPNGSAAKEQDMATTAFLLRRKRATEVMEKLQQGKERHASWLPALKSVKLKAREKIFEDRGAAIALYLGHDASIAVSEDGHVVCVLELERLFGVRYFRYNNKDSVFLGQVIHAFSTVRDHCPGGFPSHFKHGLMVSDHVTHLSLASAIPLIVEEYVPVEKWHWVDHHEAHALLAYHSSPFRTALVVSYDGGGNDGSFNAYVGRVDQSVRLERIAQLDYNLGESYSLLGGLLPEVSDTNQRAVCNKWRQNKTVSWQEIHMPLLGVAGRLMGYSAISPADEQLTSILENLLESSGAVFGYAADAFGAFHFHNRAYNRGDIRATLPEQILEASCTSTESQRILAASIEKAFESTAVGIIWSLLQHVGLDKIEGLVLSGGCALSIRTNQRLYDRLIAAGLGFFVPPAPNDCGLTVGALYSVTPPRVRQPLQYIGFELWDLHNLEKLARRHGAVRVSRLGGLEYVAALLAGTEEFTEGEDFNHFNDTVTHPKHPKHPIIAVVRGRQEFGPRALGHRSLLAVTTDADMPDRMNRLKARQWYRPVAPMIAEEAMAQVFGKSVPSPYMTMAPMVKPEIRKRYPALSHFDGTARHQSVSKEDEPWVHALLMAVGKLTGLASLINTSFNTKGKPIINTVRESLKALNELPDLDFVLIEDWLFAKRRSLGQRATAAKAVSPFPHIPHSKNGEFYEKYMKLLCPRYAPYGPDAKRVRLLYSGQVVKVHCVTLTFDLGESGLTT